MSAAATCLEAHAPKREFGLKPTFVYTGIRVRNLEASLKFYTELLGMQETSRTKIAATGGEVVSLVSQKGGPELELNYYPEGSEHAVDYTVGEGLDHLAFRVENLDEALAKLAKAGHPKVLDIDNRTGRWAYVRDPDGIYIELVT